MGVTIELLPLTTIEKAEVSPVYQDVGSTIDTSRYSSAVITAQALRLEAPSGTATLDVEGSDDGQSFFGISSLSISTSPGSGIAYLNRSVTPQDPAYLWRYLRWVITPTAANLQFCGRITVVLK